LQQGVLLAAPWVSDVTPWAVDWGEVSAVAKCEDDIGMMQMPFASRA